MSEHELTPEQEEKVQRLSGVLKFVAIGFGVMAAGHAVGLAEHLVARDANVKLIGIPLLMSIKNVVVFSIIFQSLTQAANDFSLATKTKGSDVSSLMNGIQKLTTGLNKLKMPLLIMAVTGLFEHLKSFKN